jgi:hypothetical protein
MFFFLDFSEDFSLNIPRAIKRRVYFLKGGMKISKTEYAVFG